jgi:hypothetical protein
VCEACIHCISWKMYNESQASSGQKVLQPQSITMHICNIISWDTWSKPS